jgi:hypothetical protein
MQDRIGHRDDAFGAHLSGGRAKERQQFGRAPAFVLVRLQDGMPFRLPRGTGLRDGLVRSGFIFIQLHNASRFCMLTCQLDQSFFSGVCSS